MLRFLKTSFGKKQLLLVCSISILTAFIIGLVVHPLAGVIGLVLGGVWLEIVILIREVRNQVVKLNGYTRTQTEGLRSDIGEVNRRSRRVEKITRDTAGTVGRSAPLIREIRSNLTASADSNWKKTQVAPERSHSKNRQFPEAPIESGKPRFDNIKVFMIADEFTAQAFALEWNQKYPTPDNWRELLKQETPDFLFVESAWEGNSGAWKYHLVGPSAPRPAIIELVEACNKLGVPTIFWNKEDPPHFEDFLDTARLFDFVYTTDGNLIEEYKTRLGHENIFLLPFAAQPKIHNPARVGQVKRQLEVAFGGMYFRHKYPERKQQLSYLLPAAQKFQFDIYSRQIDGDDNYQFPDPYHTSVRGKLSYLSMITAYHAYKVILNVNSVVNSPTMCARRIFEATACGAAVVTPPSPAIDHFYPNEMITVVDNEEEAYNKMRALLRSDEYRSRKVHLAQRHTWEHHTYSNRVITILDDLNLEYEELATKVSCIVSTNRPKNIQTIFENVGRQTFGVHELLIVTHGFNLGQSAIESLKSQYEVANVSVMFGNTDDSLGANLNRLVNASSGDTIVRMDDDDWYGPNYVRDMVNAIDYSGADIVGKACSYIYLESMNSTILTYAEHENRFTNFVRGATLAGPRSSFERYRFPELNRSEDSEFLSLVRANGGKIYSSDRFNFVVNRLQDKDAHTWKTDDAKLFGSGEMKFVGDGRDQLAI